MCNDGRVWWGKDGSGTPNKKSFLGHEYKMHIKSKSTWFKNSLVDGKYMNMQIMEITQRVTWGQVLTDGLTGGALQSLPSIFTPTVNTMRYLNAPPIEAKKGISKRVHKGVMDVKIGVDWRNDEDVFDHRWFQFLYY